MPTVNTKTVRKLVRPRPLHNIDEARCHPKSSPHVSGQIDIASKNTECVLKLWRRRPLCGLNAATSNVTSRDPDEGTSPPLSLSTSELVPGNTGTPLVTPERELYHAFEQLLSTIVEDEQIPFRTVAEACSVIKTRGPVIGKEQTEQLDQYFDKLRKVACEAKLRATVRLMLLEIIELRSWDWNFPETLEKFYNANIAAQKDVDSRSDNPTATEQTPVRQPVPRREDQIKAKEASQENIPPNFATALKVEHGSRTFGDDVVNRKLAAIYDFKTPDGCESGRTCDPASGRHVTQFIRTVNVPAETAKPTGAKDSSAYVRAPNRTQPMHVSYSRDFLLECSRSPYATDMPPDFPALDPAIETIMVKQYPMPFDPDRLQRRPAHRGSRHGTQETFCKYMTEQNDRGSNPGKLKSSAQAPLSRPVTGPEKRMTSKEESRENNPSNFSLVFKVTRGNRTVRDDVATEELAAMDDGKISDGGGSEQTRDTGGGRDAPQSLEYDRAQPVDLSYSRDFLLECSRSPYATDMPPDFPALDPAIETLMVKKTPMPFDPERHKRGPARSGSRLTLA